MPKQPAVSWLIKVIHRPGFWLIAAVFFLISIPHYGQTIEHPTFVTELIAKLGLERHAWERILYLAPIIWSGFLFERRGATIASLVAAALMLPRAIFFSPFQLDALFETGAVFIVGNLVAFTFDSLRKERERRIHLAALNQTSSVVSQSLELSQVLNGSIESVIDVMKVDIVLVFLLDEEAGELALAAHKGVSEKFVQGVGRIKSGEGFNGRVAQTGEPLFVGDASRDPSLTKKAVMEEGIQSQFIVPLKSKGKVVGTLCAATRSHREFHRDEVELLTAIANQIGVAVENARLYQQQREVAEQLRASEERYRELFENAHDAIWLHEPEGNIIAANKACVGLTGYSLEELRGIKANHLLAGELIGRIKDIERALTRDEAAGYFSEMTLVKKDKSEASIQLSTSPVFSGGQVVAIQHIARDVTEEKRMRENLRFHLQGITKAQEDERGRIARELHDETIQALVVLLRQLDDLTSGSKGLSEENRLFLENLRQQTNAIMEGVRRLSQDLRPATLERLGLLPALKWLASEVEKHSGITVEVKAHGNERRLPPEIELVLFRIAQEALRNVWRHSEATSAAVVVEFDERKTKISVKDNGKGFGVPETVGNLVKDGRLGLAGMHERAQLLGGNLKIKSEPGKGTTVTIEAPI